MKLTKRLLYIAGATLLLGTTSLSAKASEAAMITKNMFKYVGSLDHYAFDAVVTNDDIQDGKSVKHTHQTYVKVDRPGKFRIDVKGDIKDRGYYLYDGTFTMIDRDKNYYGQLQMTKGIDMALDTIFETYGIQAPLALLIYSNMDKKIKISQSKYFGKVTLDGTECNYVALADKDKVVYMWIQTGDKPLAKRVIIVDKKAKGEPRSVINLKWDTDTIASKNDFKFVNPKDVSKISIERSK